MTAILKVEDLGWTPPNSEDWIIRRVNLDLEPGDLTTLRGSSGSGKSTLLRCIIGLERPDEGRILWQGREVSGDDFLSFRNLVRYVQQRPTRVADTIREDLGFARDTARERGSERRELESLQRERLDILGLGDLDWERNFDDLSVGEQQRVALVRSLTSQPRILLLDEPTSSLDPERVGDVEEMVQDYLHAEEDERAILWVTHQSDQVERLEGRHLNMDDLNELNDAERPND